jgi:hypothetical protein
MISIGLSMTFLIFPYDFMAFSWHSDARPTGSKSLGRHVHGVHGHVFAAVLPAEQLAGGAAGSDSKLGGENPTIAKSCTNLGWLKVQKKGWLKAYESY